MGMVSINAEKFCVFENYDDWVNKSSTWREFYDTNNLPTMCLDQGGNLCVFDKDFKESQKMNRFPVTAYLVVESRYF